MRCKHVFPGRRGQCHRVATERHDGVLTWCSEHGHKGKIAAARAAVVKAAMAWTVMHRGTEEYAAELARLIAACAALAALEGEHE